MAKSSPRPTSPLERMTSLNDLDPAEIQRPRSNSSGRFFSMLGLKSKKKGEKEKDKPLKKAGGCYSDSEGDSNDHYPSLKSSSTIVSTHESSSSSSSSLSSSSSSLMVPTVRTFSFAKPKQLFTSVSDPYISPHKQRHPSERVSFSYSVSSDLCSDNDRSPRGSFSQSVSDIRPSCSSLLYKPRENNNQSDIDDTEEESDIVLPMSQKRQDWVRNGDIAYKKGDSIQAIFCYETAARLEPQNAYILGKCAEVCAKTDRYSDSIKYYTKAVKWAKPKDKFYYAKDMVFVFVKSGDFPLVVSTCKELQVENEIKIKVYSVLIAALLAKKTNEPYCHSIKAFADFAELIGNEESVVKGFNKKFSLHSCVKPDLIGDSPVSDMVQITSEVIRIKSNKQSVLIAKKDFDTNDAISLNNLSTEIGACYFSLGIFQTIGLKTYGNIKGKTSDSDVRDCAIKAFYKSHDIEACYKIIDIDPSNKYGFTSVACFTLAEHFSAYNTYEDNQIACDYYNQSISLAPHCADAHLNYSIVLKALNKNIQGRKQFQEAQGLFIKLYDIISDLFADAVTVRKDKPVNNKEEVVNIIISSLGDIGDLLRFNEFREAIDLSAEVTIDPY